MSIYQYGEVCCPFYGPDPVFAERGISLIFKTFFGGGGFVIHNLAVDIRRL